MEGLVETLVVAVLVVAGALISTKRGRRAVRDRKLIDDLIAQLRRPPRAK